MRKIAFHVVFCSAFVMPAGSAMADASECAWAEMHHTGGVPTDFGNGIVAQEFSHEGYHSDSDYWGATRLVMIDCARGKAIELTRTATNGGLWNVINKRRQVQKLLDDGANMSATEFIVFAEERARKRKIPLEIMTFEGEDCGCGVFYPNLRDGKEPNEVEQ